VVSAVHVAVDRDRCCGAGHCVIEAPEVFDQDERDGVVILLDASPPASLSSAVRSAARQCPSLAITLEQ
jgi:ferredoxin